MEVDICGTATQTMNMIIDMYVDDDTVADPELLSTTTSTGEDRWIARIKVEEVQD